MNPKDQNNQSFESNLREALFVWLHSVLDGNQDGVYISPESVYEDVDELLELIKPAHHKELVKELTQIKTELKNMGHEDSDLAIRAINDRIKELKGEKE